MRELIKVDRNGTKYWRDTTCGKCGGRGVIPHYRHVDNGTCFECGGSGFSSGSIEKEYTEEYAAKLEARRQKRAEKKLAERKAQASEINSEFLRKQGFNQSGKTYVILGDTYPIKDELKEKGAKWSNLIGWHLTEKPDEYPNVEIDVDDVYSLQYDGTYIWQNWKTIDDETYSVKIREANDKLKAEKGSLSNFVGEIGERLEVKLELIKTFQFTNNFSGSRWENSISYIHKFADKDNNVFVWRTSKEIEELGTYLVRGTVKEHSEYKDEKQTVLTRCKVERVEM